MALILCLYLSSLPSLLQACTLRSALGAQNCSSDSCRLAGRYELFLPFTLLLSHLLLFQVACHLDLRTQWKRYLTPLWLVLQAILIVRLGTAVGGLCFVGGTFLEVLALLKPDDLHAGHVEPRKAQYGDESLSLCPSKHE